MTLLVFVDDVRYTLGVVRYEGVEARVAFIGWQLDLGNNVIHCGCHVRCLSSSNAGLQQR